MNKYDSVKDHIRKGGTITGLEAIRIYGLYRLSSLICKLRNKGWPIKTVIVENGAERYAKYYVPINERKNIPG